MEFDISRFTKDRHFYIKGLSYIGAPKSNTAMYITLKVGHLAAALESVNECLVFAEEGITVTDELLKKHLFMYSKKPQLEYSRFANLFEKERLAQEKKLRWKISGNGYFISEDCSVAEDAYVEPGCIIGPDVIIGKNARILAGTVIRHTTIGDDFISNQNSVIGTSGFTMTEDEEGNKIRIPTLGRVIIGNQVEIGAHDNISCGSGGDTVIEDYVKLDALVYVGHDVHLCKNVVITAGVVIGGFDVLGEHAYVGINAALRNRINIGENAVVGMGATVTKSIESNITVVGNPARFFIK